MYMICVSDLVQESKEYERFFGKVQANGIRTKGLLDEFHNLDVTPEKVANLVAEQLVEKGLFEDAIDLYDIANVSNTISLSTINLTLSLFHRIKLKY